MKKFALALGSAALVAGSALADGTFDPTSLLGSAETTITGIVTALGSLLGGAAAIYLAFVGWRKFREACNKV